MLHTDAFAPFAVAMAAAGSGVVLGRIAFNTLLVDSSSQDELRRSIALRSLRMLGNDHPGVCDRPVWLDGTGALHLSHQPVHLAGRVLCHRELARSEVLPVGLSMALVDPGVRALFLRRPSVAQLRRKPRAAGGGDRFLAAAPHENVLVASLAARAAKVRDLSAADRAKLLAAAEKTVSLSVIPAFRRAQALLEEQLTRSRRPPGPPDRGRRR